MAETIVIDFQVNNKELKDSVTELEKLGTVSKKDADTYRKMNEETAKTKKHLADASKEQKKFSDETKKTNTTLGSSSEILKNIAGQIALAFSVSAVAAFAKASVQAFREAEVNANKLKFAVTAIGEEGEAAFQKLINQSARLQSVTIFSDDDIQRAQTQLVQFGLTSSEVERLIPKILDLASATGTDLAQATDTLIQGINGQARALKPLGLEFVNTGDKAQNLAIITDKLSKFQGASSDIMQTSAGRAQNLANQFDDLKEKIGGLLESTGVLRKFNTAFSLFIKSFETEADRNKSTQEKAIEAAKAGIEAEIEPLIAGGKARIDALNELQKYYEQKATDVGHDPTINANNAQYDSYIANVEAIKQLIAVKTEVTKLGLTEEEQAKRDAQAQEELNKALAARKALLDSIITLNTTIQSNRETDVLKPLKDQIEAQKAAEADMTKFLDEENQRRLENATQHNEDWLAEFRRRADEQERISEMVSELEKELAIAAFDFAGELAQASADNELDILRDKHRQGLITEQQFQEQSKTIRRKAAETQKLIAIFEAIINTAVAITKGLKDGGPIVAALYAALGAIQVASIAARPIPKFKHGTLNVMGGNGGVDDIPAFINRGEAIIPTETNKAYHSAISAIYNKKIPASLINSITENYIKTGSVMMNNAAPANPYDWKHALNGMQMNIKNAEAIGKSIAKYIPSESKVINRRLGNGL